MGGDLSDDDSIHLHTPPKGRGRCCASRLCMHSKSRYYPSGLCSDCHGYAHDKDCAQIGYDGIWMPGKDLVCVLCVQKHGQNLVKEAAREKRKIKDADRKIINEKTAAANVIHSATNPFNYNAMTKVLKEKKLAGFLAIDQKKKADKNKRAANKKKFNHKSTYGFK
jgi:hypothetical protein